MTQTTVDQIARAVLYEGYLLYPYRPSVKNRQRWTFGGLCPRAYGETRTNEAWSMQAEVLVRGAAKTKIDIRVRCLHLQRRTACELVNPVDDAAEAAEAERRPVDMLQVEDLQYATWEEAVEQERQVEPVALRDLLKPGRQQRLTLPAHRAVEPIRRGSGEVVGVLLRERQAIEGRVEVSAERVQQDLFRVRVAVWNETPWPAADEATRDEAMARSLISTHLVLSMATAGRAEFMSLTDPPEAWRPPAEACRNVGCWPVLVGEEGRRDTMLASPIILYDYPQIAPESPGDLFDATEIDEMLSLRILTLTEREKREMVAVDERARTLLERTERLRPEQWMNLHGTLRGPRNSAGAASADRRGVDELTGVPGTALRVGDRVRLQPRRRADAFDIALKGKLATVAAIEQDHENRVHLAITVDDDPGREFGEAGKPGHRFYFQPDEVEPLKTGEGSRS